MGEASANYGVIENATGKHKYFFDVGLPTDEHLPEDDALKHLEDKVIKYFTNNDVEAVILSHWHTDHVKGAFLLKNFDNINWIAPHLNLTDTNCLSIQRLGCYLYSKKLLTQIPSAKGLVYSCKEFILCRGKGPDNENPNNRGLMLQLHKTLLPGDCKLYFWPDEFAKNPLKKNFKYKYLIFPHHGAKMRDYNGVLKCLEDAQDTFVIIPTGYNLYNPMHPMENYNIFKGKNYIVFPTNPVNNELVGNRLFHYYDKAARGVKVNVQNSGFKKENKDFSIQDI